MIIYWLTLLLSFLFVNIYADVNKPQHLIVAEHKANDILPNDSLGQSSEKILIRVPRMDTFQEKLIGNHRQRRDIVDTDEIWGMAKKVAITVFVLIAISTICCIVTTIYIFMKCCCGGNNNRKRNQGFNTIPQPIVIHTTSPNYHPQYHQQQAPPPPASAQAPLQTWQLENHPMLPQPSAPPQPTNDSYMERPPPYEKICAN